jgi:hypothetical protein
MAIVVTGDWQSATYTPTYITPKPVVQLKTDQTENKVSYQSSKLPNNILYDWQSFYTPTFSTITPVVQLKTDQTENKVSYQSGLLSSSILYDWQSYYNVTFGGLTPIQTKMVSGGSEISASATVVQMWKTGY